jgi:lipopolysaccharide/colanic/teichoic acid biosynthesis glycosyltransferase
MQSNLYLKFYKRMLDISLSFLSIIILFPFFLLIGLLIKLDSKGKIFFIQKRIGKNFKAFYLYKFRSMIENAEKKGPLITNKEDGRITHIGKFLRKTKLDELPQLFNVLKGDMSLVGPRPEVKKYVEIYKDDYEYILSVKPGITDQAAIEFRDEEIILNRYKDDIENAYIKKILPIKIEIYKKYIDNVSFLIDTKLIFNTLMKILYFRHYRK